MAQGNRKILLIRHGEPDLPEGPHRSVSMTDYELSAGGVVDATKAAEWLLENGYDNATIISSPLTRCQQTARVIADKLGIQDISKDEDFREISCGIWENMTFQEIKENYPEDFKKRGQDLAGFTIPGGENFYQVGDRFANALNNQLASTKGDVIVVAHAGVIRGFLLKLKQVEPQKLFDIPMPYAGITMLNEEAGTISVEMIGFTSEEKLDDADIERMYRRSNTLEHIIKHMQATAEYQSRLLDRLEKKGITFNRDRLDKAAKLHDIRRLEHNHALEGAKFIRVEGYEKIAELISNHHSAESLEKDYGWNVNTKEYINLCDADILYYADKRVKEDQLVSAAERFATSRDKVTTPEGKKVFEALYKRTVEIENELRTILGEDFI